MELRTLRYLVAIADAGTITAAANAIHISQPALVATNAGIRNRTRYKAV